MHMPLEQFSNVVACLALIAFGVYAILRPVEAAAIAHLKPDDAISTAEIRISFGGLSGLMGVAPLILGEPVAYQVVGIVFLGAFILRLITMVVDHPEPERMFVISGIFELVVGLVLFIR